MVVNGAMRRAMKPTYGQQVLDTDDSKRYWWNGQEWESTVKGIFDPTRTNTDVQLAMPGISFGGGFGAGGGGGGGPAPVNPALYPPPTSVWNPNRHGRHGRITPIIPAPVTTIVDDWQRVVAANGWGVATCGIAWQVFLSSTPTYFVDGTDGNTTHAAGATRSVFGELQNPIAGTQPWAGDGAAAEVSVLFRFMIDHVYATSAQKYTALIMGLTRNDATTIAQFEAQINNFPGQNLKDMRTTNVLSAGLAVLGGWAEDVWYNVRMEYEPGVGARYRCWLDSVAEPATWDEDVADPGIASNQNDATVELFVNVQNRNGASASVNAMKFGDIEVTPA